MTGIAKWSRVGGVGISVALAAGVIGYFMMRGSIDAPTLVHRNAAHGKPAPSFALKDSKGKAHSLSELGGSFVVLHFWASWCPPCVDEIREWTEAAHAHAADPIKFVAVSLDKTWSDAQKLLPDAEVGPNMISLLDVGGKVADEFGSFQYPETYLLSPELRILAKWVGAQEWKGEKLTRIFAEVARVQKKGSKAGP